MKALWPTTLIIISLVLAVSGCPADDTEVVDGAGGFPGADNCMLDVECDPQDFENPTFCDGPCRTFCRTSGTDSYGSCGGDFDPSMPLPDTYYCVCHCFTEECP